MKKAIDHLEELYRLELKHGDLAIRKLDKEHCIVIFEKKNAPWETFPMLLSDYPELIETIREFYDTMTHNGVDPKKNVPFFVQKPIKAQI